MQVTLVRHIVIGMAGHIDHGKTSIVRALTGVDTDRLKEEKERGMTTDLGFAFFGDDMTIIDVPGHEKFVRTMVAGVNTIDFAVLVVAADDGVMPQTREHLEILRLLNIPAGLVVLNKIDLAQHEWLDLVAADIRDLVKGTFLDQAPIIPVSTVTGEGVKLLGETIHRLAGTVRERENKGVFRLPIDRVFTIKGFGTVVAGTVLSGSVKVDETLELLPQGIPVRIRGIQVHDHAVGESSTGQRTALNLQGVEKEGIERGNVLCSPGFFRPTSMLDARMLYLSSAAKPLGNRSRVHVHIGTSEVVARLVLLDQETLAPGNEGFVQFHFEQPVVADAGDRYVVRSYSPVHTIGGGCVLDVHPEKHRRFQEQVRHRLDRLTQGDPAQPVLEQLARMADVLTITAEIAKRTSIPVEVCHGHLEELSRRGAVLRVGTDHWCAASAMRAACQHILDALTKFHREQPLRTGMLASELHTRIKPALDRRLFDAACAALLQEARLDRHGERLAVAEFKPMLSQEQKETTQAIMRLLLANPLMPPGREELLAGSGKDGEKLLTLMVEMGEVLLLEDGIIMHRDAIAQARARVEEFFAHHAAGTMSEIRQHLGISPKYAVPLLVHFDHIGVTEREGDLRSLKHSAVHV